MPAIPPPMARKDRYSSVPPESEASPGWRISRRLGLAVLLSAACGSHRSPYTSPAPRAIASVVLFYGILTIGQVYEAFAGRNRSREVGLGDTAPHATHLSLLLRLRDDVSLCHRLQRRP